MSVTYLFGGGEAQPEDERDGWVDPGPVRSHIHRLLDMGLSRREIARRADLNIALVVRALDNGYSTMKESTALAIMAVDHDTRQGTWTERGQCRTTEAQAAAEGLGLALACDLFFPPDWVEDSPVLLDVVTDVADDLCRSCPVRGECLAYAIDNNVSGRWAGTTEMERSAKEQKAA